MNYWFVDSKKAEGNLQQHHWQMKRRRSSTGRFLKSKSKKTTLEILKEILIIGLLPEITERCYQVNVILSD